jgi:hypothetical protein
MLGKGIGDRMLDKGKNLICSGSRWLTGVPDQNLQKTAELQAIAKEGGGYERD